MKSKRTIKPKGVQTNSNTMQKQLMVLELMNRIAASRYFGYQYGGDRDLFEAFGYPKDEDIPYAQYWAQYKRQDIAAAIINRPVDKTWKGEVSVYNPEEGNDALHNAWQQLYKDLFLKDKFIRVDKLSTLGRYGVLVLGFSDVKSGGTKKGQNVTLADEVKPSAGLKLLYVQPYDEANVSILTYDNNTSSPRYGRPQTYQIKALQENGSTLDVPIHHSRIIHITGERLNSEVYGVPALERVFNRLMDIEKLVGGSAEMFWRGARPGYTGKVNPEFTAPTDLKDTLDDQMKEYEHGLRRMLISEGVDIQALAQQISDPSSHIDVQIQMISAITNIPKRILTGSELGELASSQDWNNWIDYITTRRTDIAEALILKPFVDRLMELNVLPKQDYTVEWEPLVLSNEKDKAEVGRTRTEALRSYASEPLAAEIIPTYSFMRHIMGFTDDVIEAIQKDVEETMQDVGSEDDAEDIEQEEVIDETEEEVVEDVEVEDEEMTEEPIKKKTNKTKTDSKK